MSAHETRKELPLGEFRQMAGYMIESVEIIYGDLADSIVLQLDNGMTLYADRPTLYGNSDNE